jgi:hypothetical protein
VHIFPQPTDSCAFSSQSRAVFFVNRESYAETCNPNDGNIMSFGKRRGHFDYEHDTLGMQWEGFKMDWNHIFTEEQPPGRGIEHIDRVRRLRLSMQSYRFEDLRRSLYAANWNAAGFELAHRLRSFKALRCLTFRVCGASPEMGYLDGKIAVDIGNSLMAINALLDADQPRPTKPTMKVRIIREDMVNSS